MAELLLKILKSLDLTWFHHLCQTSKYIRAFIKRHAIELCNNIVRVKLKEGGLGKFFDMREVTLWKFKPPLCMLAS